MAQTIANNGFQGDIAGLVAQLQTFNNNSNAFDMSQGGLFSRASGTNFGPMALGHRGDRADRGVETQNCREVAAAVEQLATNSRTWEQ